VIATRFRYEAPASVEAAVQLVAADPEGAVPLSGGTWVVPELNGGREARSVVDLRRAGLGAIEQRDGHVHVGATCTYADLLASPIVAARLPLLRAAAAVVTGGRQILNQGTVGGSAAAARPQSDMPATLVALAAEAVILGRAGARRIRAAEFFVGAMRTALGPGELLARFEVPVANGAHGYYKLKRSESSWPIATAAALLEVDQQDRVSAATLVLGGVTATPLEVPLDDLNGARSADLLDAVGHRAQAAVTDPWEDELAPASYRAAVAAACAMGGG